MSALRTTWRVYGLLTLVWLLSTSGFGHAGDLLQGKPLTEGDDLLRVPVSPWVQLTVDVEEYRPFVEYVDHSSSVTRSLAILPSLRVVAPNQHFQPYLGGGFGLGLSGFTPRTAIAPLPLGLEESLVLHVGGGIVYRFGEKVALTSSARFTQFKTTELFQHLSSAPPLIQDGLDFSAYTVEFGLRWAY